LDDHVEAGRDFLHLDRGETFAEQITNAPAEHRVFVTYEDL
jgi:hypothetical protein